MAFVGQTSTQAPQSAQVLSSILALPSTISIAPVGQASLQSPQPSHFSKSTTAGIVPKPPLKAASQPNSHDLPQSRSVRRKSERDLRNRPQIFVESRYRAMKNPKFGKILASKQAGWTSMRSFSPCVTSIKKVSFLINVRVILNAVHRPHGHSRSANGLRPILSYFQFLSVSISEIRALSAFFGFGRTPGFQSARSISGLCRRDISRQQVIGRAFFVALEEQSPWPSGHLPR